MYFGPGLMTKLLIVPRAGVVRILGQHGTKFGSDVVLIVVFYPSFVLNHYYYPLSL